VRHLPRTTLALVAFVLVTWGTGGVPCVAAAQDAPEFSEADRLHARAEEEESRFDLEAARADYDACVRVAPSGRWASACRARADDLSAHSEGAFAPLITLERARHGPQDAHAIDALARDADGFPDGPVRSEARMLAAEAYLDRLGREADGARMLALVAADPNADPLLRRFAARRAADIALAGGRFDDAAEVAERASDPELVLHVVKATRRHRVHLASIVGLALVGLGAARAMFRSWRAGALRERIVRARAHALGIVGFAALAGGGGAALSAAFERGHAVPFLALGVVIGALGLLARVWAAVGTPSHSARVARATLCALAVLGAAFLVLERADVRYLEGFGL
jgi:hypothetical protein